VSIFFYLPATKSTKNLIFTVRGCHGRFCRSGRRPASGAAAWTGDTGGDDIALIRRTLARGSPAPHSARSDGKLHPVLIIVSLDMWGTWRCRIRVFHGVYARVLTRRCCLHSEALAPRTSRGAAGRHQPAPALPPRAASVQGQDYHRIRKERMEPQLREERCRTKRSSSKVAVAGR
jgi:hypothetical protein